MTLALLTWAPLVLATGAATAYVLLSARARGRRPWPVARTVAFLAGTALLVLALSPLVDAWADRDFAGHAAQHVLVAMVAPLGLVLGAPVTLLLRALPPTGARRVTRLLHRREVRLLTRPAVALLLSSGGLIALYLTPLYELSTRHDGVHVAVHLHLLLAGLLFTWVIAGPDPAPGRPPVRSRLLVLAAAVAVHATIAQLLHGGFLVAVHEPAAQMRAAGSLMYFGGDLAEVALALATLAGREPAHRPRPRRMGTLTAWLSPRTP